MDQANQPSWTYAELCEINTQGYTKLEQENQKKAEATIAKLTDPKKIKDVVYMRAFPECKELNLWTYWQGRGVRHPKILLLGQDWASPFDENVEVMKANLKRMDQQALDSLDDDRCHYFDDSNPFPTDVNLRELFMEISPKYDKLFEKRYDDLFFSNVCLGYRDHGASGGFQASWITDIEKRIYPELVKLLEPQVIICLGRNTFEQFIKIMNGKKVNAEVPGKGFNGFIEKNNADPVKVLDIPVFAFAHCGSMGTLNRNKGADIDTSQDKLAVQKQDWRNVRRYL